jgi:hypothetical protein
MKSKLLTAALGGLLLLGSGLAMADDGGRGRYDRGGHRGWHDRGWNDGPRWGQPHRYRGHGHEHWKHGHRSGHQPYRWHDRHRHYRGHYGHYGKGYDRGDDITIIFRGSLD